MAECSPRTKPARPTNIVDNLVDAIAESFKQSISNDGGDDGGDDDGYDGGDAMAVAAPDVEIMEDNVAAVTRLADAAEELCDIMGDIASMLEELVATTGGRRRAKTSRAKTRT